MRKLSLRSPSATPPSDNIVPPGAGSPGSHLILRLSSPLCGPSKSRYRMWSSKTVRCSVSWSRRRRPITCCRSKTSPGGAGLGFRAVTSAFTASTQIQAGGVLNKSAVSVCAVSVKSSCKRPLRKAKSFFWREQPSFLSHLWHFSATTMHFQARSVSVCVCVCVPVSHCLIVCRGLIGGAG